jgi:hypothetical protein
VMGVTTEVPMELMSVLTTGTYGGVTPAVMPGTATRTDGQAAGSADGRQPNNVVAIVVTAFLATRLYRAPDMVTQRCTCVGFLRVSPRPRSGKPFSPASGSVR